MSRHRFLAVLPHTVHFPASAVRYDWDPTYSSYSMVFGTHIVHTVPYLWDSTYRANKLIEHKDIIIYACSMNKKHYDDYYMMFIYICSAWFIHRRCAPL